jgi:hypothetical protein
MVGYERNPVHCDLFLHARARAAKTEIRVRFSGSIQPDDLLDGSVKEPVAKNPLDELRHND